MTQQFDANRQEAKQEINKKIDEIKAEYTDVLEKEKNNLTLTDQDKDQLKAYYDSIDNYQKLGVILDSIAAGLSAPTNSIGGIGAAALSPAASYEIGQYFKGKDAEGSAGHIFAHTILGAAVAAAGGNDALTAGLSVGGAEAVAPILSEYLYGKKPSDLTAEEKNTISTITGLVASGIGATTGDIGSTVQSGQLAQNAVENNVFGVIDKNGNLVKGANNKTKQKLDACTNSTCVSNVLMENAKDAMVGAPLEVILDHSKYKDGDIISGIHSGSGLQYLVVNENGVLKAKLLPVEYQTIYSIYQLERSQSIVGGSALAAPLATLVVGLHDSVTGNSLFTNEELSKIDRAFAAMDAAGGFGVITGAFLPGRVGSTSNSKQSIDNNFYRDDNL